MIHSGYPFKPYLRLRKLELGKLEQRRPRHLRPLNYRAHHISEVHRVAFRIQSIHIAESRIALLITAERFFSTVGVLNANFPTHDSHLAGCTTLTETLYNLHKPIVEAE